MNRLCPNCNKQYNNRGRLCTPCYQQQYYEANKNKIRRRKQEYYKLNKDAIDKKSKEYAALNQEKVKAKNRRHYRENKGEILQYQKSIRTTANRKFKKGVKAANERNIQWNLTIEQYETIISKPCHYCKTSLKTWGGVSLDRINNSVGYEESNVLPCCGTCNNIRNRFLTVEEMEIAMKAVLEYREKRYG